MLKQQICFVPLLLLVYHHSTWAQDYNEEWDEQRARSGCQIGNVQAPILRETFREKSSLLQIFAWMRAPCEGIVRSVTFLNHAAGTMKSFYFAIFEPMVRRPGSYRIVNYVRVEINASFAGWQTVPLPTNQAFRNPLRVQPAHVFGYFYDFWDMAEYETVIPYRTNYTAKGSTFQTFVGFLSIADVRQLQELRSGIELDAQPLSRIPALIAKVSPEIDRSLSCGAPPKVSNAYVATGSALDKNLAGDFVVYECNKGFALLENMFVICQPDAIWSALPYCAPLPGFVTSPPLRPTLETIPARTPAPPSSTRATPPPPFYCDVVPEISNGRFVVSSEPDRPEVGDTATYTCNVRFTLLNGISTITCLTDGRWSRPTPQCVPVARSNCDQAPLIPNSARVDFDAQTSSIRVTCSPRFTPSVDDGYAVCDRTSQRWSPIVECLRTCGPPPTVLNARIGRVSFTGNRSTNGSLVQYVCDDGFVKVWWRAEDDVVCNGIAWPSDLPRCVPVATTPPTTRPAPPPPPRTCPREPEIRNGVYETNYRDGSMPFPGDTLIYRCDDGYQFASGSPRQITCQRNFTWSRPLPNCILIPDDSCGPARTFSNTRQLSAQLSGNVGRSGDSVTYECQPGYALDGRTLTSRCENAEWTLIDPCIRSCGAAPQVANARIERPDFTGANSIVGSFVRYECDEDYVLASPRADIVCLSSGDWSTTPVCELRSTTRPTTPTTTTLGRGDCSNLPNVDNARIIDRGEFDRSERASKVGVVVEYQCNRGWQFEAGSSPEVVCRFEGWSSNPVCFNVSNRLASASRCGRPPNVANGLPIRIPNLDSMAQVEYSCDPGFDIASNTPNTIISCLSSGRWSTPLPRCVVATCGKAPNITNGRTTTTTFGEGLAQVDDVAYYRCNPGFQLANRSQNFAICVSNGKWFNLPQCVPEPTTTSTTAEPATDNQASRCRIYPDIRNGRVLRASNGTQSRGYEWVEYACNDGYVMAGHLQAVCVDGQWTDPPTCVPKSTPACALPPSIANGYILDRFVGNASSFLGNRVTYVCDYGYTLSGNAEVVCRNQQWGPLPTCEYDITATTCRSAPTISNGQIIYKDFDGSSSKVGSKVQYRCFNNYVLSSGAEDFTLCLRNGSWSPPPRCQPVNALLNPRTCGPAPSVLNGNVMFSSVDPQNFNDAQPGTIVVYECNTGYQCKTKTCGARVNNFIQCTVDGTWTELPECIPERSCKTVPAIENGRISERTYQGSVASTGDRIFFSCFPGFDFENSRNTFTQCNSDGTWSTLPTCRLLSSRCPRLASVPNSRIIYNNSDNTVVVFGCQAGYSLVGSQILTCGANGQWSSQLPRCQQNADRCALPPVVANSDIVGRSNLDSRAPVPGDYVVYRCNRGFVSNRANNQIVCLNSGNWSESPQCISTTGSCGRIPTVQNARVTWTNVRGDASVENDVAWFDCVTQGFEMLGGNAVRCLGNQQWTAVPICRIRSADSCGNPPLIPNGFIVGNLPLANLVGVRVEYECLQGYSLIGPPSITCQRGGLWSEGPGCVPSVIPELSCGQAPNVANGDETDRNFGGSQSVVRSFVVFTCRSPYRIEGEAKITCQESGRWSQPPVCTYRQGNVDTGCGPVPSVSNAVFRSTLPSGILTSVVGDQAWYECQNGATLQGFPGIQCLRSGTWSELPFCSGGVEVDDNIPTSNMNLCPNSISLVFIVDLDATDGFGARESSDISAFVKQAVEKTRNLVGSQVTLTISGVVNSDGQPVTYQPFTFVSQSNANSRWESWLDLNIKPVRGVLAVDVLQLLRTARTVVLPALPPQSDVRYVFITSSKRSVLSVGNAAPEMAILKARRTVRAFVYGVGPNLVDGEPLQTAYKTTISSNPDFFRYVETSRALNERLLDETNYFDFLCKEFVVLPPPGLPAFMA